MWIRLIFSCTSGWSHRESSNLSSGPAFRDLCTQFHKPQFRFLLNFLPQKTQDYTAELTLKVSPEGWIHSAHANKKKQTWHTGLSLECGLSVIAGDRALTWKNASHGVWKRLQQKFFCSLHPFCLVSMRVCVCKLGIQSSHALQPFCTPDRQIQVLQLFCPNCPLLLCSSDLSRLQLCETAAQCARHNIREPGCYSLAILIPNWQMFNKSDNLL